jgi:hypothetical protein
MESDLLEHVAPCPLHRLLAEGRTPDVAGDHQKVVGLVGHLERWIQDGVRGTEGERGETGGGSLPGGGEPARRGHRPGNDHRTADEQTAGRDCRIEPPGSAAYVPHVGEQIDARGSVCGVDIDGIALEDRREMRVRHPGRRQHERIARRRRVADERHQRNARAIPQLKNQRGLTGGRAGRRGACAVLLEDDGVVVREVTLVARVIAAWDPRECQFRPEQIGNGPERGNRQKDALVTRQGRDVPHDEMRSVDFGPCGRLGRQKPADLYRRQTIGPLWRIERAVPGPGNLRVQRSQQWNGERRCGRNCDNRTNGRRHQGSGA